MTIQELRKELLNYDQRLKVRVELPDGFISYPIERVLQLFDGQKQDFIRIRLEVE